MTVNEFLKIETKDSNVAAYNQEIIIQTYIEIDESHNGMVRRKLAQGKAYELLEINNIDRVVQNLQGFTIIEIKRIPEKDYPAYNCPYLLLIG